jgi:xanthine dehydrogenase accessory factor
MPDLFDKIASLRRGGEPFAVATVVGRRPPVSAHLGDQAIVYADGRMEGFVGGACSREIVRKQALASLRTRHACLVSIRPDASAADASDPEHVVVPMTCVSEGAVDVYVEPVVRARRLVIVGATPVADALTRTASALEYDAVRVVTAGEQKDVEMAAGGAPVVSLDALESAVKGAGEDVAAVVASQGHYDEEALETILRCGVSYVGLVASRKRGETVRAYLEAQGAPGLERLRNPAGLDLGARTPSEVALSILAEIVKLRPAHSLKIASETQGPAGRESGPEELPHVPRVADGSPEGLPHVTAIDPVCHMEVTIATARHTAEVDGRTHYFCCAQCRARFVKAPASFLEARA